MKNAYVKPEAVKVSFELADSIMTKNSQPPVEWVPSAFNNVGEVDGSTVFE